MFGRKDFLDSFIIVFLIVLAVILFPFAVKNKISPVYAKPLYTLRVLTPADQIRNGEIIEFGIEVDRYKSEEELLIGAVFDARKLKLEDVKEGDLGEIKWVVEQKERDGRIIIRGKAVQKDLDSSTLLAVLQFRIDDKTGELNEAGFGYTQLCSLFFPDEDEADVLREPVENQIMPTAVPFSVDDQVVDIEFERLDKTKLCIPLVVNGSPADKMDWVFFPVNYDADEYDKFFQEAKLGIQRLAETNIWQYKKEVFDKMNWYAFNPSHRNVPEEFRGKRVDQSNLRDFLSKVHSMCPRDRYIVLVGNVDLLNSGGSFVGGEAAFYIGFIYPARGLYIKEFNTFAHEWGHAAAGLMDEYDTGQWIFTNNDSAGFNCTLQASDLSPVQDPCRGGVCGDLADDPVYKKPCPKWDCSKKQCSDLEKKLFADAGCFPRCSIKTAFRPAKVSVMDGMIRSAGDDIRNFNGVSLYSIIKFAFGNYR